MKTFPCPICKGSGIGEKGECVDVGIGMVQVSADWPCGWCVGEGMVEIGGTTHLKRKAEKKGYEMLTDDQEYTIEQIREMGAKSLGIIIPATNTTSKENK
jgi:hypothetical protein